MGRKEFFYRFRRGLATVDFELLPYDLSRRSVVIYPTGALISRIANRASLPGALSTGGIPVTSQMSDVIRIRGPQASESWIANASSDQIWSVLSGGDDMGLDERLVGVNITTSSVLKVLADAGRTHLRFYPSTSNYFILPQSVQAAVELTTANGIPVVSGGAGVEVVGDSAKEGWFVIAGSSIVAGVVLGRGRVL